MGTNGATLTRRETLGLAGSGGVAILTALRWSFPARLGLLRPQEATAAGATSTAGTKVAASFHSQGLGSRLHFVVYLPSGYSASSNRYPVVYFLHGLPATSTSYLQLDWVAHALEQSGREAILVVPQGTRVENGDPEYHNWGPGDDWEYALAQELPAWIDNRYRTLAHRSGRAIAGYSAGGYGASIIGLHHPRTFAAIQSWSGYFHPTDPTGTQERLVGSRAASAYASVEALVPRLAQQFRRYPTAFAFYVGASDPTFVPANTSLQRSLASAAVSHLFRVYPGGHTSALWKKHAPAWLAFAVDSLTGAPAL